MIKVADFCSVGEQHPITKPIETVCQNHFSFGAGGDIVDAIFGCDLVADTEIDLTLVRVGEGMWLPERHVSIIAGK